MGAALLMRVLISCRLLPLNTSGLFRFVIIRVLEGGVGAFGGGSDDRSIVRDFREARDLGRDDGGVESTDISRVVDDTANS